MQSDDSDDELVEASLHEPVLVRYRLVGHPTQLPDFAVAYVDGNGAWKQAPPLVGGDTYILPIRSRRFGIAFTCRPQFTAVFLRFFAVAETTDVTDHLDGACVDPPPAPAARFQGTVTGAMGSVSLARGIHNGLFAFFAGQNMSAYSGFVTPGTHDLVVMKYVFPGSDQISERVLIVRDFTIPPEGRVFDFDISQLPAPRAVQLFDDVRGVIVNLTTANGTHALIGPAGPRQFALFPSKEQVLPTDTTIISAGVSQGGAPQGSVTQIVHEPPIADFIAMPPLGTVTASPSTTGFMQTTWTAVPRAIAYRWSGTQLGARWEAYISPGWLPGETKFVVPDLRNLGWSPSITMQPNIGMQGFLAAIGGNGPVGEIWPVGGSFELPLGLVEKTTGSSRSAL